MSNLIPVMRYKQERKQHQLSRKSKIYGSIKELENIRKKMLRNSITIERREKYDYIKVLLIVSLL